MRNAEGTCTYANGDKYTGVYTIRARAYALLFSIAIPQCAFIEPALLIRESRWRVVWVLASGHVAQDPDFQSSEVRAAYIQTLLAALAFQLAHAPVA